MAKSIPLTQGQFALVDDEDYERVMQYKWYVIRNRNAFYAVRSVRVGRRQQFLTLAAFILNVPRGTPVDHINRNTLDDQHANLRLANPSLQSHNQSSRPNSTSQYKGVTRSANGRRWRAEIARNGRTRNIGTFDSEYDAARAYDAAAREIYGMDAFQNFPEEESSG